jgi:hypothetical protein
MRRSAPTVGLEPRPATRTARPANQWQHGFERLLTTLD